MAFYDHIVIVLLSERSSIGGALCGNNFQESTRVHFYCIFVKSLRILWTKGSAIVG